MSSDKSSQTAPPPEFGLAERIELEVDLRLCDLLIEVWASETWTDCVVAAYLRLAYAAGYQSALQERRRGQLFRDLDLPVPKRERS